MEPPEERNSVSPQPESSDRELYGVHWTVARKRNDRERSAVERMRDGSGE